MRTFFPALILFFATATSVDAQLLLSTATQTGGGGTSFLEGRVVTISVGAVAAGEIRFTRDVHTDRLEDGEIPQSWHLGQNYPNPFRNRTTIVVDLPRTEHVRVTVFDMAGRAIGTMADGILDAGRHRLAFDATGLASGIYLYRILTDDYIDTRRMTVVR